MEKTFAVGDRVYMIVYESEKPTILSGVVMSSMMTLDNYSPEFEVEKYQVSWDFCPEWLAGYGFTYSNLHTSKNDALNEASGCLQKTIEFRVRNGIDVGCMNVDRQGLLDMRDLGSHPHIHSPTSEREMKMYLITICDMYMSSDDKTESRVVSSSIDGVRSYLKKHVEDILFADACGRYSLQSLESFGSLCFGIEGDCGGGKAFQ